MYPRLNVLEAYKRALTTWSKWVDKNINRDQTHVVFRGYSVTHFRYIANWKKNYVLELLQNVFLIVSNQVFLLQRRAMELRRTMP